ncbi:MAG TPA: family 43 glycosylhydrolase [Armatimonadota bacterium]|jgi:beta-xylosidase
MIVNILIVAAGLGLVFLALEGDCAQPPPNTPPSGGSTFVADRNPVFRGADPHAIVVGTTIWVYPTVGRGRFDAFSSADLRTWERHNAVLELTGVKWIHDGGYTDCQAWAPGVVQKGGKFYMYFSVGPQSPGYPSRIGVAVGDSPAGPFVDSGKPLLTGGNGFEAIDAMVFDDPKTHKFYFYAGGSAGATLRVFEMNPDMVSFAREIKVNTPPHFTEGSFMHYRNGVYYFTYSHGWWEGDTYSVYYVTSTTPVGPWKAGGKILSSDDKRKGPGHHSIIKHPDRDEWYIVYHRWENQSGRGPYRGSRQVAIDKLEYGSDGSLKPVTMTNVPPRL